MDEARVKYEVIHSIPGRLRLRVPWLKNQPQNGLVDGWRTVPGVTSIRVNYTCASVVIKYDTTIVTPKRLLYALARRRATAAESQMTEISRQQGMNNRWRWLPVATAGVAFALTLVGGFIPRLVLLAVTSAVTLPVYSRATQSIVQNRRLNVDVLDAAAAVVMTLRGNLVASAFMVWLISVGEYIRELTAQRSHRAVMDLLGTVGHSAWAIRQGRKVQVSVEELKVGDIVVLYPGDLVPVDGTVVNGKALVDQKTLTGEPMPVVKSPGDTVYGSTVLSDGKLYVRAQRVGYDTKAGKIIHLIESAPRHDTRIENYASKFADQLVPPAFLAAGAMLTLTRDTARTASFLIVDFGTGIRVTAPTTILASMAVAARNGVLIKGGRSVEKLAEVDTVVFDKTGTLTRGDPGVVDVISLNSLFASEDILRFAAAAEMRLKHPAARAIVRRAEELRLAIPDRGESQHFLGSGVRADIGEQVVHVGNARLMHQVGVSIPKAAWHAEHIHGREESLVFVALDDDVIGVIAYADPIRPESRAVVEALRALGIRDILMVTGDHRHAAIAVASELGIDDCYAEVLPQQKADIIQDLQTSGRTVAVIGDGVNDSPAFAYADIAVCLDQGADAAKQAAGVILMRDTLWELPLAVEIAREAMVLVRQNYQLTVIPCVGALGLATLGVLGPIGATLISNGSTILAGIRSLKPLFRNGHIG